MNCWYRLVEALTLVAVPALILAVIFRYAIWPWIKPKLREILVRILRLPERW